MSVSLVMHLNTLNKRNRNNIFHSVNNPPSKQYKVFDFNKAIFKVMTFILYTGINNR